MSTSRWLTWTPTGRSHAFQRLLKMAIQRSWIAEFHESAERTFTIWSRGIDKDARHRPTMIAAPSAVKSLTQAC